jgi:hypothetical protein
MSAAVRSIATSVPIRPLTPDEQKHLACEMEPGATVDVLRLAKALGDINEAAADTMASIDALCDAVLALLPEQPSNRRYFAARQLLDEDIRNHVGRLVERIADAHTACALRQLGRRHG